jgi:hypothetical protein
MKHLTACAIGVAGLFVTASALADLPPPDGTKFVGFSFTIKGVDANKNMLLLAYPCGPSDGAPDNEIAIEEGKSVDVGSHLGP